MTRPGHSGGLPGFDDDFAEYYDDNPPGPPPQFRAPAAPPTPSQRPADVDSPFLGLFPDDPPGPLGPPQAHPHGPSFAPPYGPPQASPYAPVGPPPPPYTSNSVIRAAPLPSLAGVVMLSRT